MESKVCNKCKEEKSLTEFFKCISESEISLKNSRHICKLCEYDERKEYRNRIKIFGMGNHHKNPIPIIDENLVIEKYKELRSVVKVKNYFGISNQRVKNILDKNNIKLTNNRKYFANETYFDNIDSEEKAYWLGFFYADGYIRERPTGNSLEIKLGIKDIGHIELFKKCIESDHKIVVRSSSTKSKKGKIHTCMMAHFSIYSNRLVDSIKKQGFHSRKTFTIDKPNIDSKYYRHFIRGYFDGDGCCYIGQNERKLTVKYGMATASEKLKNFMIEELENNSIHTIKDKSINFYIFRINDCLRFFKYMYDDSTICLERKKDKGKEFVKYFEEKQNSGVYCFQDNYVHIERFWCQKDIDIVKSFHNKIPLSYLRYSILPHKSFQQIFRLCKKLGIKNDIRMSRNDYENFCIENNIVPYLN